MRSLVANTTSQDDPDAVAPNDDDADQTDEDTDYPVETEEEKI